MSLCMTKPTIWVPTRTDTNQPVQSQKQARGLKFWIKEGLYYPCSESVTAQLSAALFSPMQIVGFLMRWFIYLLSVTITK